MCARIFFRFQVLLAHPVDDSTKRIHCIMIEKGVIYKIFHYYDYHLHINISFEFAFTRFIFNGIETKLHRYTVLLSILVCEP